MELESILSVVEPSNRNAIWLHPVKGKIIQKIYGPKGWEVINNGGSGEASIPEATIETAGVVKLGTYINEGWIAISNIIPQHGSGIGFSIDSAVFTTNSHGVLSLKLGFNGGLKIEDGLKLSVGTSYKDEGVVNAIPLCIGTCANNDYFSEFIGYQDNVPFMPANPDQFKLGKYGLELINSSSATKVTWDASSNMNDFKTPGVYEIYGERTRQDDNLPILNASSGHSIAARLTVVASTLQPANNEICVTQFLQLSNRVGREGATYIRTYNENNNSMNGWSPWQKQMGMIETLINSNDATVGQEVFSSSTLKIGDGLNGMVDNGMYSGIYINNLNPTITGSLYYRLYPQPTFVETFVLVVINDYAASGKLNLPRHITQLKYAVDAITGQSTVKKRVGTGSDTISWSDWEDIGGGISEVDITEAIKAQGLPTLIEQGLAKEGVTYVITNIYTNTHDFIQLDKNDKIISKINEKFGGTDTEYIIYIKVINNSIIIESFASNGDGMDSGNSYLNYLKFIMDKSCTAVSLIANATEL